MLTPRFCKWFGDAMPAYSKLRLVLKLRILVDALVRKAFGFLPPLFSLLLVPLSCVVE